MNQKQRLWVIEGAVALAPVVMFAMIRSGGPAEAAASGDVGMGNAAPVVSTKAPALTMEQQRAEEWVMKFVIPDEIRSPLDHASTRPAVVQAAPAQIMSSAGSVAPPPNQAEVDPLKDFVLTSVVGNNEGGLALINGSIFKLGEEPVAGYKITAIEPRLNHIVVTGPDDKPRTINKTERKNRQPGQRGGSGGGVAPRPQGPPRSAR